MYAFPLRVVFIVIITSLLYEVSFADDRDIDVSPSPDFLISSFDEFVNSFPEEPVPDYEWIRTSNLSWTSVASGDRSIKRDGTSSDKVHAEHHATVPVYIGVTRTFYEQKIGEATLYMNGDFLTRVTSEIPLRFLKVHASPGDVIAASATHTEGLNGLAIILKIGTQFFPTGGSVYKAKSVFESTRWNRRFYHACSWRKASSQGLPAEKMLRNAEYVWAERSGKKGVYFRFVIGGEDCSKPKSKVRKLQRSKPYGKSKNPHLSHHQKSRNGQKHRLHSNRLIESRVASRDLREPCDCKQVGHRPNEDCFMFATLRFKDGKRLQSSQKCMRQTCGANYKCVENGEPFTSRCIMKAVNFKVVKVKRLSKDVFKCRRILMKKPAALLVPHQG